MDLLNKNTLDNTLDGVPGMCGITPGLQAWSEPPS